MSSDTPLEFFLDRSLGKATARHLREHGAVVHLIADCYSDDAQNIEDQTWIAEGCRQGWVLLTKDQRIRHRSRELEALDGYLFCLSAGNATVDVMAERLIAALPAIARAVARGESGFWLVYADSSVRRKWP